MGEGVEEMDEEVQQTCAVDMEDEQAFEAEARVRGKCPDCDVVHTWDRPRGTGTRPWPSDQFRNCPRFMALSSEEKAARIERAGGCPRCSSWRHGPADCRNRRPTLCEVKVGSGVCDRPHLQILHESKNAYCHANSVVNASINERGDLVLLGVQKVKVAGQQSGEGILFYDSGSTLTLCRHDWARRQGYVGRAVEIYLKVLTHQFEKVRTQEYEIRLLNTQGQEVVVFAIGLEALTP